LHDDGSDNSGALNWTKGMAGEKSPSKDVGHG
jgi:hypothetical protein